MTSDRKIAVQALLLWAGLLVLPLAATAHLAYADDGHAKHGASAAGKRHGAAMPWTTLPTLKIMMGGRTRAEREASLLPRNFSPTRVEGYASDPKSAEAHRTLEYDLVTAKLGKPKIGGFHWLSATEETPEKVVVASTVYYMGERGAVNPTAMFMQHKSALEIIPEHFPREHSRYRANEVWKFVTRYQGKPLANQKVHLETQNGTRQDLVSDANGMVAVTLPDDFAHAPPPQESAPHMHGRKSAEFVLATERVEGGVTYLTSFSQSYGPDAFDQRSLALGLGFMALGMLGAAPLLRNRKKSKASASDAGAGGQ